MPLMNGKSPEELAHEIVNPDPVMIDMDGNVHADLVKITRYHFRDTINVRGEKYWEKAKDDLIAEALKKLITDKCETLVKYINKKEEHASMEYYKLLRSKGMSVEDASAASGVKL